MLSNFALLFDFYILMYFRIISPDISIAPSLIDILIGD
jgi:hypothetical protein